MEGQRAIFTKSSGLAKARLSDLLSNFVIVRLQIGEAPVIPDATDDMGVLSLLPTQVATSKLGV